jgi:DNA modification methylase
MLHVHKEPFQQHLLGFKLGAKSKPTKKSAIVIDGVPYPVFINEFWTSRQRQCNAIHEISYRACFKPQLPHFFIALFTNKHDFVYDPFNGRGTTVIEAALMDRNIIANDVNPLSLLLTRPRLTIPSLTDIKQRLSKITISKQKSTGIDLTMFYHPNTLNEIVSLRNYLIKRVKTGKEDDTDRWIRMVATNRLTGHSKGFFSVYSLPPNQAVSAKRQTLINKNRKQKPEYRDTKLLIIKKSKALLKDFDDAALLKPRKIKTQFLNKDAAQTKEIASNSVALTVTSPPFLDIVQYAADNWLRCWFNNIDIAKVEKQITMSRTVEAWQKKMGAVFKELYRITRKGGVVAFEVGEVRKANIKLEEVVIPLGLSAGFDCMAVMVNSQNFTKTANIWGVSNNKSGTNSNRIVVFRKK